MVTGMEKLFLALLACLAWLPAAAQAQSPAKPVLKATYGLYTGGVRMIDVDTAFTSGPDAYKVETKAHTIGIFAKLLPWSGAFMTEGTDGKSGSYLPTRHEYGVRWREDEEKSIFAYKPAGVFTSLEKTEDGKTSAGDFDPEVAKGTVDMLSALMRAFRAYETTGKCAMDVLAFDSARSFTIRFADKGDAKLENPRLSAFTGTAHGCTVEVIPEKGKWPKKPRGWLRIQKQAAGKLPTLWLARPAAGMPVIPVRVDIHTKYGDVIAHLAKMQ